MAQTEPKIKEILNKVDQHQTFDKKAMDVALSQFDSYINYWVNTLAQKKQIANTRFQLQKTIGTLFDQIHPEK